MLGEIRTVLGKELLDAWRDRRTWLVAMLIPMLITPLMMVTMTWLFSRDEQSNARPKILIENPETAPGVSQALQRLEGVDWVTAGSEDKPHLRVNLPEGFEQDLAQGKATQVILKFDSSKSGSSTAVTVMKDLLNQITFQVGRQNLAHAGLSPQLLPELGVELADTAQKGAMGAVLLSVMLPMILAMAASVGGLSAAVDTVAGEKERGTFEILITSPVSRTALALGKYTSIVVVAGLSFVFTVVGVYIGIAASGAINKESALAFELPPVMGALLVLNGVMLAALFAALQLALSALARNFKEAQAYISPLAVVPMLAAMGSLAFDPGQAPVGVYQIPVLNTLLVMRELLSQKAIFLNILFSIGTTGVCTAMAVVVAGRLFQRESVLFRS